MSTNAFQDAIAKFGVTAEQRVRDAFLYMTEEVQRSVIEGSELTGAPGQPVRTGALKSSWVPEFINGGTAWQITTNNEYAPYIEDGANDRAFFDPERGTGGRSQVGGYHSVKLTESSIDRIADYAVKKAIAGKTNT